MNIDPDKEKRFNMESPGEEQPEYFPDEIIKPRTETKNRVGEVVYPNDRAGEIVRLSDEVARLRQNQMLALQSFEKGLVPSQLPMHDKVAKKYNEVQIQQLEAMQEIIEAQKKAKLNETKAGNIEDAEKVSQFNRNRILEYSKTGAKSIGFAAKYAAMGALWVTKIGLLAAKETAKATADIWYALWGAHRDYREKYPNQNDI